MQMRLKVSLLSACCLLDQLNHNGRGRGGGDTKGLSDSIFLYVTTVIKEMKQVPCALLSYMSIP